VLGAIAGWGQVAMCAEYLSSRMFSWQRGHWSTFISDRMFLPFQFLPLSFYTPLLVSLLSTGILTCRRGISASSKSVTSTIRYKDSFTHKCSPESPTFRPVGLLIVFGMGFLLESGGTFHEVRARDRSEEFPMRKVHYACREKATMNTLEARI
jgi:hypothetical protein